MNDLSVNTPSYLDFLESYSKKQWHKFGLKRRAGVVAPLFSIYSSRSAGIGEIPDLKRLADWCERTGMSIIQLLPLNDVGFNFTPYDSQSTFALDPMHLSLADLRGIPRGKYKKEIEALRAQFPLAGGRVNYQVKRKKLELLLKIFSEAKQPFPVLFDEFSQKNKFWIDDYALFKAIKETFQESGWEHWDEGLKFRRPEILEAFRNEHAEKIRFHTWLQWQLFEQFSRVREYVKEKGIFMMGDLPFLVSRDSADVWANQAYFKLDLVAGAPPDAYFALGQRWGMPPYHWGEIEKHAYDYLIEKIRYAENFYDLFRIDHVVGIFRLWTIPAHEPQETYGLNGTFDPEPVELWENHGRRLLQVMIENTTMLPCAEDLGVVPDCSYKVLKELSIPGMDVQRWTKDEKNGFAFLDTQKYRTNSMAVISTHDMSTFRGWWLFEAGTVDEKLFERKCAEAGIDFYAVRERLFDLARSKYERLRWKPEIDTVGKLLEVMGRTWNEIHDMVGMYQFSFDEKRKFWEYLRMEEAFSEGLNAELAYRALFKAGESASIFSIQLIGDWMSLSEEFKEDPWDYRINVPGTLNEKNWSILMPFSLEAMMKLPINDRIAEINKLTARV